MSYTKTNWIARVGTALIKFLKTNETPENVELTNDPTGITTAGTPFTVNNMNHIEDGIEANDQRLVDPTGTPQGVGTGDSPTFSNATIAGHNIDTKLDNSVSHIANTSNPHSVSKEQITGLKTTDNVSFATVNTGYGAKEIGQSNRTTDNMTFATVNTGQGANELYDMNQNVKTNNDVEFNSVVSIFKLPNMLTGSNIIRESLAELTSNSTTPQQVIFLKAPVSGSLSLQVYLTGFITPNCIIEIYVNGIEVRSLSTSSHYYTPYTATINFNKRDTIIVNFRCANDGSSYVKCKDLTLKGNRIPEPIEQLLWNQGDF